MPTKTKRRRLRFQSNLPSPRGESHAGRPPKLSAAQRAEIERRLPDESNVSIAKDFPVTSARISQIRRQRIKELETSIDLLRLYKALDCLLGEDNSPTPEAAKDALTIVKHCR